MKQVLTMASSLILIFPMLSPGKRVKPLPTTLSKPQSYNPGYTPSGNSAFKTLSLNTLPGLVGPSYAEANQSLTVEAKQAVNNHFNNQLLSNKEATVVKVVKMMSDFKRELSKKGVSPKRVQALSNSFIAAGIQAESWDIESQRKVFEIMNLIKTDPEEHKEQADKIMDGCLL